MGIRRIVSTVIALALLGVTPVLLASAAEASSPSSATTTAEPAESLQARRKITIKGREPRPNVFFLSGKVKPDYKKKKAFMLKKLGTGSFKRSKKFRTDKRSKFKVRVAIPPRGVRKVCYRVVIPRGGGYKKSQSKPVCIVRL